MKFVLASYGSRGDIEPFAAVGRELLRRGHDVRMAVPPDLTDFIESVGIPVVAYGPDTRLWLEAYRDFCTTCYGEFWNIKKLTDSWAKIRESKYWPEVTSRLASLCEGVDVIATGGAFERPALNVADHLDVPLATVHHVPIRPNGRFVPVLPAGAGRAAMKLYEWLMWRIDAKIDDEQRRQFDLQKAKSPSPRRIAERGSLEIQAYDQACFPGLASEWASWNGHRPFVGALTLELPTDVDEDVKAWIAAGTPPICFGFGSLPVESPTRAIELIAAACALLGVRGLVCAGATDFTGAPLIDHVRIVGAVNYAAMFPACQAVVHHGGSGTTAASMRAGVPTLVLWTGLDQAFWGTRIKRLGLGTSRRFATTSLESLVMDLRKILSPTYIARAAQFATRTTKSSEAARTAADLMEDFARMKALLDLR